MTPFDPLMRTILENAGSAAFFPLPESAAEGIRAAERLETGADAEDDPAILWARIYFCVRKFFDGTDLLPHIYLWLAKSLAHVHAAGESPAHAPCAQAAIELCKEGSRWRDHPPLDYGICFCNLGWSLEDRAPRRDLLTLALHEFSLIPRDDPFVSFPLEEGYLTESALFLCDCAAETAEKERCLGAIKALSENWLEANPVYPEEYGTTCFAEHVYVHAAMARIVLREHALAHPVQGKDTPALHRAAYHLNYALMLCKTYFSSSWPGWNRLDQAAEPLYSAACLDFQTENASAGRQKLQKCFSLDPDLQKRARFDSLLPGFPER